ncbi:copper amine oxidase N-terminal domain-containing protein [Paenibacillus sp. GCM10027626]|uniref:copper amine oxidase N-terminal domain-containing protein n=1 Tax=Paenibacillus sp. GCM10027626 TaxID=3273411 RepID=UPI00363BD2C2
MKKNKAAVAALTAAMMMVGATSAGAAAAVNQNVPISAKINDSAMDYIVAVNGAAIADSGYLNADGKTVMLPLRALGAALGYEVKWQSANQSVELASGAQWTSVTLGKDQYSFAKKAIKLGIAPESRNGKIYVPETFAEQVLLAEIEHSGKRVNIKQSQTGQPEVKTATSAGIVTNVDIKDGEGRIQINGVGTEGTILNVGPESKIVDVNGQPLKWSDLLLGVEVEAEHSMAMTNSLPPQTALYVLKVKTVTEAKEMLATAGEIEETTADKEAGITTILIKGQALSEHSAAEVKLHVGADTEVVTMDGQKADSAKLVKGAKVIGFYGPTLTRSLPPIGQAWKVVISE